MLMVVGEKGWGGGCHPSSSWQWLFSGGGHGEKGGVSPFIFMVMVIQWWWSWGKRGVSPFIFMVLVIQWWWSWGKGGGVTLHLHGDGYSVVVVVGKKGGGGVTLHLHGDGYSVVVVVGKKGGCHPSSSW